MEFRRPPGYSRNCPRIEYMGLAYTPLHVHFWHPFEIVMEMHWCMASSVCMEKGEALLRRAQIPPEWPCASSMATADYASLSQNFLVPANKV